MPTLTIRNVDSGVHKFLRKQAAEHGRSMEEEVRIILRESMEQQALAPGEAARRIHAIFAELGGADDLAASLPQRDNTAPRPMSFKK